MLTPFLLEHNTIIEHNTFMLDISNTNCQIVYYVTMYHNQLNCDT